MSSELSNNLASKSYTVYLSSADKISGTNNNGQYMINWQDFLPTDYTTYKVAFSYQSGGGNYADTKFASVGSSISGTTLTVVGVPAASGGVVQTVCVGQLLSAAGILPNTYITSLITGTGGNGTYTVSQSQTLGSTVITGSVVYTGCKIVMNSLGRSFSFDTASKSESFTIGYAQRDIQLSTSSSNSFSAFYLQFPPKTINRPNQNVMTISIYNLNNNFLLTDTWAASTTQNGGGFPYSDMTVWNMILEFSPVLSTKR